MKSYKVSISYTQSEIATKERTENVYEGVYYVDSRYNAVAAAAIQLATMVIDKDHILGSINVLSVEIV